VTGSEVSVEILNYRKDGTPFWNELYLSPIHDDDNKILYYFGSQVDVTELRKVQRLEASEHRLLREVDHRAKNVLALVNSIVRLSRSSDPGKYAASVQNRVEALADAHGLLAERRWESVPLGQLLERQIAQFRTPAVALEGPRISLPALQVQPVALVLHELITNAATHGALSVPAGKLRVHWEERDRGFRIDWHECGGQKPNPDAEPGFGSIIMSAIIEQQLRGTFRRVWTDNGLDLAIDIPTD
jgi:two-component sensor histidine kinase